MYSSKMLESDKATDRDIFNYISQQMLSQGIKSVQQWYDEDADIIEDGDECQYFSYDMRNETNVRCAIGWIMNKDIFQKYESEYGTQLEGNGIQTTEPLEVVILSNENWEFTKESWVMLSILQRIHDNSEAEDWKEAFENMSLLFNSDGKFCPNYVTEDHYGNEIEHQKMYYQKRYDVDSGNSIDEEKEHFVDFEELGISFKIPHHNANVVNSISDAIRSDNFKSCVDFEKIGLNILDAENQQTADTSAMNFLDIMDAVRLNKQERELIPNGGE